MKLKNFLSMGLAGLCTFALIPANGAETSTCGDPDEQNDSTEGPDSGFGGNGDVYLMTNQVPNAIMVFNRGHNGNLNLAGTFPTGGNGDPVAQAGDPPIDPLGSQFSLLFKKRFVFAVNAGSNEISVMRVTHNGLSMVQKVASGGTRPISLTVNGDHLYVLNEGDTPNITGFTIGHQGHLTPLADSTRPLNGGSAADPAEVNFSPRGDLLVVTEKDTNNIDTYTVGNDGIPTGSTTTASHGMTPFGFAFDQCANLIVSEAFGAMPNQAAASSYRPIANGELAVISGSVPNSQTASCWVTLGRGGRYAFISNTGSGTLSTYRIQSGGVLTLANATAADLGADSGPIDSTLDKTGRFLYVHAAGLQKIAVLRVNDNGELTLLSTTGSLPLGAQGIAAR